jgi:hypothetical protein
MRHILLPFLLAPVAALAQGASKKAEPAPDVAKLTFAWPASVRARVEAERYRERQSDGKHDTTVARISYRMTAERQGEEYVMRFDDFQLPGGPAAASEAALVERLGGIVPSYRVSAAGEFARLEAPEKIRAAIDSMMASVMSKDKPPPAELKHFMATMTSDDVLAAGAAQEWNALVGTWVGAELEVGQAYVTSGEEPVPIFQNANVRFDYEFAVLRRLSCDSTAAPNARDCVELQMISKPDSAAMRQLLDRFMSSIVPDAAGVAFTNFDVENVVTLVARPETLLPVYLSVYKEVTGAARAEGKEEKLYQVDVRTQWYRYDR